MPRLVLALPIIALGLTACTGSTDPATGTVFDNFRNLQSGEFDRQIAAKQAQARSIEAANARSQSRINTLERQRASNASAIAGLRGQVSSLRSQISAARAANAGNAGAQAQLAALNSQVNAVNAELASGGDASIARSELLRIRAAVAALSS